MNPPPSPSDPEVSAPPGVREMSWLYFLPPSIIGFAVFWVLALVGTVVIGLSWRSSDARGREEAARYGPIPAGLEESGTVEAEAIYAQGNKFFVLAHEGIVLRPKELVVGWDYPMAEGTVEVAFKQDAHSDDPIRVDFKNEVLRRDPVRPVLNTSYLVHLHNLREVMGAGWISGEPPAGTQKVAATR